MSNNIAVKITADVADLTAKRAVLSVELKAATKDLNDLAKAAKNGMTDELRAKMLAAATAVAKTRAELSQLNHEMAELGKRGNAAALANITGGLKSRVLEEATAKLGPLGAGLEALGPAGLAAAAGIGAVTAVFEGAAKTAEWAEQLERASKTLGLTSVQLQEFDFVAQSVGIPVDRMRESLSGLEKTIGLVESGLARSMQTKAFTDGLKITPEQLRGWGDLEHQLPHIVEALSQLDPEERAAISQRLKIDPEVVTALVSAKDRIGDLIDEAHRYGIVLDEDAIRKSADAAEKLHVLSAVVQGETRVAFAQLTPLVAESASGMTHFVTELADVARGIGVVTGPLAHIAGDFEQLGPAVMAASADILENVIPGLQQVVQLVGYLRSEGASARRVADLHAEIMDRIVNPPEKPKKPVKLSEGNAKGPSVVSEWTEQLHAQEIASGEFFKDQTTTELAFWQDKLAKTKAHSKEWLEISAKIYEAQKTLAHQAYDQQIASLNEQLEAERGNWTQEKATWDEKLAFIAGKYGEKSTQAVNANREFLAAERAHQKQLTEIAKTAETERLEELRSNLKAQADIRKANASVAEGQINENARGSANPLAEVTASAQIAALHKQLNQQELHDIETTYAAENQLRTQAVADALRDYTKDSTQYAQADAAKKKADNDFYNQHRTHEAQMVAQSQQDALKVQQAWTNSVAPVVKSFGDGITGMIKGTKTLAQALEGVGETILNVIIEAIERWVTAQIVAMITGQAAGKSAAAAQVATAIGVAGANGVASMAGAPFPLDLGAPAFGASMAMAAASLGAMASLDVGTNYVPNDMLAQIHAGERIIPKADNAALMSAISGGGAGPGDTHLHVHNTNTVHGHGMEDVIGHLGRNQRDLSRLLEGMARNGRLTKVFKAAGLKAA